MVQDIFAKDIKSAYGLFHEGILALALAERQGMRVDVTYINRQSERITRQIVGLETQFYFSKFFSDWKKSRKGKATKININSSSQLGEYLYGTLELKPTKLTATGKGSTDVEAITQLNIPELNKLLEAKKLKKLRDTYLAGFLREAVDGFIHPFFNLHLVRTFRGSSNSPNFQNVPKRDKVAMQTVRQALYPREGNQLLELDYEQLEVKIATCYHEDPNMLEFIRTGHDFHLDFTKEIFQIDDYDPKVHKVLRAATKNGFVFPEFYGDYYKNCATYMVSNWCNLPSVGIWKAGQGIEVGTEHVSDILLRGGIKSATSFERHLKEIEDDMWNNRFKVYAQWKERWWKQYQKQGYFLSKTGFLFKGVMTRNDAINYPVQGAAFHILLLALIHATKALEREGMKTRIVGQIHDAIVLDVYPPELKKVVRIMKCIMENDVRQIWKWINVPLKVDAELCPVDGNWAEKQDYKI